MVLNRVRRHGVSEHDYIVKSRTPHTWLTKPHFADDLTPKCWVQCCHAQDGVQDCNQQTCYALQGAPTYWGFHCQKALIVTLLSPYDVRQVVYGRSVDTAFVQITFVDESPCMDESPYGYAVTVLLLQMLRFYWLHCLHFKCQVGKLAVCDVEACFCLQR